MARARQLAERGWHVFPLRPRDKRPLPGFTKWEQRACTDPSQIERWWAVAPYNIGIATGPSDLLVIDCDVSKDVTTAHGVHALTTLAQQACEPVPETLSVATPSGGMHYYFRQPTKTPLGNTAGKLAPKIDTRGVGGYVVAPGSVTSTGYYAMKVDRAVAFIPDWIIEALMPVAPVVSSASAPVSGAVSARWISPYVAAILQGESERVRTAVVGSRNNALNIAAYLVGQLVGAGEVSEADAVVLLVDAARGHVGHEGFSATEMHGTIKSGLVAGRRRPRYPQSLGNDRG